MTTNLLSPLFSSVLQACSLSLAWYSTLLAGAARRPLPTVDTMHRPTNLETAPWAGPFILPSVGWSSPSSVPSSLHKQKLQPPVTKYRKRLKRGKTSSASFNLEETFIPFSSLWNSSPLVSSSESSEELAFTYQIHIPQPWALTGPMGGNIQPSKVTAHEGHSADCKRWNMKTVHKPWHVSDSIAPRLSEGEWSQPWKQHFSCHRKRLLARFAGYSEVWGVLFPPGSFKCLSWRLPTYWNVC